MPGLSPAISIALADALLLLHVGIVAFVVLGTLLILAGGWRGWRWVRNPGFRLAHLVLVLFIALQAWLGRLCPLTTWEQGLRNRAGQATYGESFMQHWLSRLIFFEAPGWVFVAAYTGFAALVAGAWWWVRPRWSRR
ncbi:DUF2784 domain-containing protein [Luteimonas vadosa]|uniref:DUF2784 domain-containing protein n=1 Tax=Luteimonas vadosa TaxID=1165507 RepID=A0ABP9DZF1_9GAMM